MLSGPGIPSGFQIAGVGPSVITWDMGMRSSTRRFHFPRTFKPARWGRRLDLQAKIVLILVSVVIPTFLIVTVAENKFTQPILEDELRQVGITTAKTLSAEIIGARWLSLPNPTPTIEAHIQEILYLLPNIQRIDVVIRDAVTQNPRIIASNVEEEPGSMQLAPQIVETVVSEFKTDEAGVGFWDIRVPIEVKARDPRGPKRVLGNVHLVVSLQLLNWIGNTLWRTTAYAAAFSVVTLLLLLSYFLRKTIANDRLLRQAESQNLQLTEQLHEAQRKLTAMGQLTASFAHEIGTPLNAIGGHLQLLEEDAPQPTSPAFSERMEIINGQLAKIEEIVKGFLQSTAKPSSQRQLVDVNRLVDKTIGIVAPRCEALRVEVRKNLDRKMGPLRIVPLDLEQILLNLVNNSLDSMKAKGEGGRRVLDLSTGVILEKGREWAQVSVHDTGEGIDKDELSNVFKPFYTTKRPGEGTGLGLTICHQLVRKYGGVLELDSKKGAWTRVLIKVPYQAEL